MYVRKFASKNRANKEQHRDEQAKHEIATGDTGLFSLINSRLGEKPRRHSAPDVFSYNLDQQQSSAPRQSKFSDSNRTQATPKPQDRKTLIAHQVRLLLLVLHRTRTTFAGQVQRQKDCCYASGCHVA